MSESEALFWLLARKVNPLEQLMVYLKFIVNKHNKGHAESLFKRSSR